MENSFLIPSDEQGRKSMDLCISAFGDTIKKTLIGKSVLGREINAYTVGEGGRRVIFFGAHHASESITCNLLFAFIHKFATGIREGFARECALFERFSFLIVPCLNPDGVEIAMHGCGDSPLSKRIFKMLEDTQRPWQANARGVDLNHNYDFGFYKYKQYEREMGIFSGASLYSGEYPESEPESRAAARLVRASSPIGILSFHSQGEEIIHTDDERLTRIASRLERYSGYKDTPPTGSASYGGLSDYTSSLGIPSFTVEVGKGENPLPITDLPDILGRLYTMTLLFPTFL